LTSIPSISRKASRSFMICSDGHWLADKDELAWQMQSKV
jgi:hypothetical protein